MTIWPAWQHFEEDRKGSVEVGKLADFVVLSRDPTQGVTKTINKIKVTETITEVTTVGLSAGRTRMLVIYTTPCT
jgi:predicted amidohydrolase YtcJ